MGAATVRLTFPARRFPHRKEAHANSPYEQHAQDTTECAVGTKSDSVRPARTVSLRQALVLSPVCPRFVRRGFPPFTKSPGQFWIRILVWNGVIHG